MRVARLAPVFLDDVPVRLRHARLRVSAVLEARGKPATTPVRWMQAHAGPAGEPLSPAAVLDRTFRPGQPIYLTSSPDGEGTRRLLRECADACRKAFALRISTAASQAEELGLSPLLLCIDACGAASNAPTNPSPAWKPYKAAIAQAAKRCQEFCASFAGDALMGVAADKSRACYEAFND